MSAHAAALGNEARVTEAEYLASEFEVDPDLIDGHMEERFVGDIEHSNWQRALLFWFAQNTGLLAAGEIHVRFPDGSHRIPDVAVFHEPPQGAYVKTPPLAVIEILSPSDTFRRLKERMRAYEVFGVKNLFVVESRSEFSSFKADKFLPVLNGISEIEGTQEVLDWKAASALLWPNPAAS